MPPERIEHVVVLMLENRSFDHLLGYLDHPCERFTSLRDSDFYNQDADLERVGVTAAGSPQGVDPDHSHAGALAQMAGTGTVESNGGFVLSFGTPKSGADDHGHDIMNCLDPAQEVPVLSRLALDFAVCTRWFCSVPGATWPNRNFAHAATSDGTVDIDAGFYRDLTVFEALEKVGKTWRVYYDGTPQLWCFLRLWKPRLRDVLRGKTEQRIANWRPFDDWAANVANDDLASYIHRTSSQSPSE